MVNKWELISRLNSSGYRMKILNLLSKTVKTPSILEKETNIKFSHVSRTLKELKDMKLIKCHTPRARKGKIYHITNLGREILKKADVLEI